MRLKSVPLDRDGDIMVTDSLPVFTRSASNRRLTAVWRSASFAPAVDVAGRPRSRARLRFLDQLHALVSHVKQRDSSITWAGLAWRRLAIRDRRSRCASSARTWKSQLPVDEKCTAESSGRIAEGCTAELSLGWRKHPNGSGFVVRGSPYDPLNWESWPASTSGARRSRPPCPLPRSLRHHHAPDQAARMRRSRRFPGPP